jgi:hypothetical protein
MNSILPIENEEEGPLDYLQTVLAAAYGSVGSHEYQHVFVRRENSLEDVTNSGELSCAISTTAIFHRFGLLEATHTTVKGFEEEVVASDFWVEIMQQMPGAIGILEGKRHLDGSVKNRHTFICVGDNLAVHNGLEDGEWAPRLCEIADFKHHTGENRKVETYYIHVALIV